MLSSAAPGDRLGVAPADGKPEVVAGAPFAGKRDLLRLIFKLRAGLVGCFRSLCNRILSSFYALSHSSQRHAALCHCMHRYQIGSDYTDSSRFGARLCTIGRAKLCTIGRARLLCRIFLTECSSSTAHAA